MNGTELRSFSHFQILTKFQYLDFSRNLQIFLMNGKEILTFVFILFKTVKVSQKDKIQL